MRQAFTICVLVAAFVWSIPAFANDFETAEDLLMGWQMTEADAAITALEKQHPNAAETKYLRARYLFFMGKYGPAVDLIDQAIAQSPRGDWQMMRENAAAVDKVTKTYERKLSPKGYFEVAYEKGKDEVLLPFLFEALDEAYEALGEELGHRPAPPVRLEIYPREEVLADVSILTAEEIRTSGTIALCKYNRLMVTSPRALLRGYGWVDTAVHEYVHYVINQKTSNRVPIWMHEGLAKFLERRWRGHDAHRMAPASEHLLQTRVAKNEFITFEQMHPSMAKLPSQDDAAMAFAEVYTAMEYLREKKGPTAFRELLNKIRSGTDAQRAFAEVLGTSFTSFERDWRKSLKDRPKIEYDDGTGFQEKLVFKGEKGAKSELSQIGQPKARDHMNLGGMLEARQRFGAAIVQYRKAERLAGASNPILQNRLANSLLQMSKPDDAKASLLTVKESFPSYVRTWINLGRAYNQSKNYAKALEHLKEAARINPFDPEVHHEMAKAYRGLGQPDRAKVAENLEKLVN